MKSELTISLIQRQLGMQYLAASKFILPKSPRTILNQGCGPGVCPEGHSWLKHCLYYGLLDTGKCHSAERVEQQGFLQSANMVNQKLCKKGGNAPFQSLWIRVTFYQTLQIGSVFEQCGGGTLLLGNIYCKGFFAKMGTKKFLII